MYEAFFGLKEEPFGVTPDPRFLYLSEKHRQGLACLLYGIRERKGLVVLSGGTGTGKTILVRALLRLLDRGFQTAYVFYPELPGKNFLEVVCQEFNLNVNRDSRTDCLMKLTRFLVESYHRNNTSTLIVDEAQGLDASLLKEEIKILTSLESSKEKLLQVVLVGQPELNDKIHGPELEHLKQCIASRYHLLPLGREETAEYIQTRLKVAGGKGQSWFTRRAIQEIHEYSQGVPRVINNICENALLTAFARNRQVVNEKDVYVSVEDLGLKRYRKKPLFRNQALGDTPLWHSSFVVGLLTGLIALLSGGIVFFYSIEANLPQRLAKAFLTIQSSPRGDQSTRVRPFVSNPERVSSSKLSIEEDALEPSAFVATGEEVEQFLETYTERYNNRDIQGFLSLFSSKSVGNGQSGFEEIKKMYYDLFTQSRKLRCEFQDVRIDIVDLYKNAVVEAHCELVQVQKGMDREKLWKGEISCILVREDGGLKIRAINFRPEKFSTQ